MIEWDPTLDPNALVASIEHTLLAPTATEEDVHRTCREARTYGFAGVCVAPCWLRTVVEDLDGTAVRAVTVAGFPLGSTLSGAKAFETREAVARGADEIDVVANLGWIRQGRWEGVTADLMGVVAAADGRPVKAILETGPLDADAIRRGAACAERAGVAYVKTSTGFLGGGATVEVVRLLRQAVGDRLGVKASGGIRTLDEARRLLAAGADRLGTSAGVAIAVEARGTGPSSPSRPDPGSR
ncbi:MAG: deoxyribose-phosphate aldolase [Planctomycetota bacterium]